MMNDECHVYGSNVGYSCLILVSTVYFANIGGYPFKVEDALDYPLLGT